MCFSDFKPVPAGIPQGTRIGPWLFLAMINDLTSSNALSSMWKFAEDATVSEIVPKFGPSVLQDTVHDVLRWSNDNRFKLNSLKCEELRIDFRRKNNSEFFCCLCATNRARSIAKCNCKNLNEKFAPPKTQLPI